MNIPVIATLAIISGILLPSAVHAQHQIDTARGDRNNARVGILDDNNVELTFYNFGEFGDWMNRPVTSFNWPTGSGHLYVAGSAFIVQARAVGHSDTIIHPLETNYYEYTRRNPYTGTTYGWWPLTGYDRPGQWSPAVSSHPETWPPHWPDKPADWDGQWNGYFGKGIKAGLAETYFVMDDDADREYLSVFAPDSTDSTRGGLGIEVRVRALEWKAQKAADMIFVRYEVINEGLTTYDSAFVALFVDYDIGGHDNSSNNAAAVIPQLNLFLARSTVDSGQPGNWSPVGMLGIAMLQTPDDKGLTGVRVFQIHEYDLNNDEHNWPAISSASYNIPDMAKKNSGCFLSSGPFTLSPTEEKSFVVAYLFADDSLQLINRANFAKEFYASGFNESLLTAVASMELFPRSFSLNQNYPNPFNPTTVVSYQLPVMSEVRVVVYDLLGREVATLVDEKKQAGVYEVHFDAGGLASGVYLCRMKAGSYSETKKLLVLR